MKQVLVVGMHILGVLGLAAFLIAVLAAPGFLSDPSSTVPLQTTATIASR